MVEISNQLVISTTVLAPILKLIEFVVDKLFIGIAVPENIHV
jgi:hypothetical protein